MQDAGCRMQGAGCRVQDAVKQFWRARQELSIGDRSRGGGALRAEILTRKVLPGAGSRPRQEASAEFQKIASQDLNDRRVVLGWLRTNRIAMLSRAKRTDRYARYAKRSTILGKSFFCLTWNNVTGPRRFSKRLASWEGWWWIPIGDHWSLTAGCIITNPDHADAKDIWASYSYTATT